MDHYEWLGVDPASGDGDIRAAYVALARRFHPDQHPGARADELARLARVMARINEAYAVLRDPPRRRAYDAELRDGVPTATGPEGGTGRWPGPDECMLCGATPARTMRFEHQNGWLLGATNYGVEAPLCRCCGLSLGRSKQNRTLWAGWWGVRAFLRNLVVIGRNGWHLWRAGRLRPPSPPADDVVAPLGGPLLPGRTVWLRGGALGVAAVLVVVGASGAATSPSDDDPTSARSGWFVGSCVSGGTWVEPVPCTQPNDGEIVDVVANPADCPFVAESYVEDFADVFCIDES
ncbi:MAG: J domain-containing protein [Acidimicrobiales bacterium]